MKGVVDAPANPLYKSAVGRRHQLAICVIAALLLVGSFFLPPLSIQQQFWIVLAPIGLFGLSHGGADPMILKRLSAASPGGMFLVLAAYVSAALIFIALIWFFPLLALLMFLGLSVWHFGYTDEAFLSSGGAPRLRWLSGSTPILGPMVGHPEQTSELFAWLIGADGVAVMQIMFWVAPSLAVVWLLFLGSMLLHDVHRPAPRALVELLLVAALLVALPPLLGFAFYFCVIHSVRHFLAVAEHQLIASWKPGWLRWPGRRILPATAGALAIALAVWVVIVVMEPATNMLVEAIRVMFWALAALTLPHAVIVRLWWDRSQYVRRAHHVAN